AGSVPRGGKRCVPGYLSGYRGLAAWRPRRRRRRYAMPGLQPARRGRTAGGRWCHSIPRFDGSPSIIPGSAWGCRMTVPFLASFYPWTKAFPITSLVAWMAGMFYLPRLYVYHCELRPGSAESERFKVMERRLLRQIINPAMIGTWTFGILLVLTPGIIRWTVGWWWVKLVAVLLLSGFHG